jgi:DNA-binding NarL/FixJ family response regulator
MHISVHPVEAHLTRIYRTLGIRSRAALAQRLSAAQAQAAQASSSALRAESKSQP